MTTKKIAIFVEGQTEQIFVSKLLIEYAGKGNILVKKVKAVGSGTSRLIITGHSMNNAPFYALIFDSSNDSSVVSDIRENYAGLIREGYSLVLGLRDVFPAIDADIPLIRSASLKVLPSGAVPAYMVFVIREIEAWFIVEDWHYPILNSNLTCDSIRARLGIDTATVDAEKIPHPSDTLRSIYQLEGMSYRKSRAHVERTVSALSYERIVFELSNRVPALGEFCAHISRFFC